MDKFTLALFVLQSFLIIESDEFKIENNVDIEREFYKLQYLRNSDFEPTSRVLGGQEINDFSDRYLYEVIYPKEISRNKNQDTTPEIIEDHDDLDPYTLVRKLDEIKYMMLWLNNYCGMHLDCDKSKLNEELREMLTAVALPRTDSNISRKNIY